MPTALTAAQTAKHVIKSDEVGLIISVLHYGNRCLLRTFLCRRTRLAGEAAVSNLAALRQINKSRAIQQPVQFLSPPDD